MAPLPSHCPDLTGQDESLRALRRTIDCVAPSNANVLILGETGTGKEVVAKHIHYRSDKRSGPFVPLNCSAIPADLLESELFGHKKGTFTGAISDRIGRFELAAGGTLFLDEIGDMPLLLQVKLLRVLEERIIQPLGSDVAVPMKARIIAATHRDLEQSVSDGGFREDLYYRLNVVPITVPPLRSRRDDIPLLLEAVAAELKERRRVTVSFSEAAVEKLKQYRWPGNVRELANLTERLAVLHPNGHVDVDALPLRIRGPADDKPMTDGPMTDVPIIGPMADKQPYPAGPSDTLTDAPTDEQGFDLKEHLRTTESELIRQALVASDGVVAKAAKMLQVRRTTLAEKVKRLGLEVMLK